MDKRFNYNYGAARDGSWAGLWDIANAGLLGLALQALHILAKACR
jgi:hypothetical protein